MVAEGDRTLWQVTKGEGTPRHRSDLVQRGSQAKVLNAGGGGDVDLRFAQVDVPLSISHSCV